MNKYFFHIKKKVQPLLNPWNLPLKFMEKKICRVWSKNQILKFCRVVKCLCTGKLSISFLTGNSAWSESILWFPGKFWVEHQCKETYRKLFKLHSTPTQNHHPSNTASRWVRKSIQMSTRNSLQHSREKDLLLLLELRVPLWNFSPVFWKVFLCVFFAWSLCNPHDCLQNISTGVFL